MRAHPCERGKEPNIVITDRDRRILEFIYQLRFATREQIQRWVDWSCTQRVIRRLRMMYDAGHLDRRMLPSERGSAPIVYFLGYGGVVQLSNDKGLDIDRLTRQRYRDKNLSISLLKHELGITEFVSRFYMACRRNKNAKWKTWLNERDLIVRCNDGWKPGKTPLKPDGYVRYYIGTKVYNFFLEFDTGSETISRLRTKIDTYRRYRLSGRFRNHFGLKTFRVLVVTTSANRSKSLKSKLKSVHGFTVWIGTLNEVSNNPLFAKCWFKLGVNESVNLHSLENTNKEVTI